MIVLDASVVIAYFDSTDALYRRASALLIDHAAETLLLSALTRAEIMVRPMRTGIAPRYLQALDRLVTTVDVNAAAADHLARIRAESGLRLPGCCVVQVAESCGARVATFDDRLARVARDRELVVLP